MRNECGKVGGNDAKYQGKTRQGERIDRFGIKKSTQGGGNCTHNDHTGRGQSNGLIQILELILGNADAQGRCKETGPNGKVSISSLKVEIARLVNEPIQYDTMQYNTIYETSIE